MEATRLKKDLVYVSHKVYQRGFTQGTGGNISVRVPRSNTILIKQTGKSLGEMTWEDALSVSLDGTVDEGFGKPSKELEFHLGIYRNRPETAAIIHCHPTYSIVMSRLCDTLPLPTITARTALGAVPVVPLAPSGSPELAQQVVAAFSGENPPTVILMREHGLCAIGPSLEAAFNVVDLTEATAKQAFLLGQGTVNRARSEG